MRKPRPSTAASRLAVLIPLLGAALQGCFEGKLQFSDEKSAPEQAQVSSEILTKDPTPPSEHYLPRRTSDSKLRTRDRALLSSTLISIFGSDPTVVAASQNLIVKSTQYFGRPCDTAVPLTGSVDMGCPPGQFTQTPSYLPPSGASESLRIRACELITAQDVNIQFALDQFSGTPGTIPEINGATLQSAFELFHLGRETPQEAIVALQDLAAATAQDKAATKLDSWRMILLTLCIDPSWLMI
jgi:hypothetical protein